MRLVTDLAEVVLLAIRESEDFRSELIRGFLFTSPCVAGDVRFPPNTDAALQAGVDRQLMLEVQMGVTPYHSRSLCHTVGPHPGLCASLLALIQGQASALFLQCMLHATVPVFMTSSDLVPSHHHEFMIRD